MATLHLFSTTEALEAALRGVVREGGAIEIGRRHATLSQLVESAHAAHPLSGTRLGPLGERLLVDKVASESAGALAEIAHSRGLRRGLLALFSSLRRLGLSAKQLSRAATTLGGTTLEVVRALEQYERLLDANGLPDQGGLFDEAALFARAAENLAGGRAIAMLEEIDAIELRGIYDWDPTRLALLDALLERGLAVRVFLPEWRSTEVGDAALRPLFDALEARHRYPNLDRVSVPADARASIVVVAAASPFVEARSVAQKVRDLCDRGVPLEQIAVAAATPERRARLREAIARYQVPVHELHGRTPSEAPPVRIALSLYPLVEDKVPRERLSALLASRYVAGGFTGPLTYVAPHRLVRALRESGASSTAGEGYRTRLLIWARGERPKRRLEADAIVEHLCGLIDALCALPEEATLAAHAQALMKLLDRLELFQRARGFRADQVSPPPEEARSLARDQGAVRELEVALTDLPRAAVRAGLGKERLSRMRFSRLLGEALSISQRRGGGARGAAVLLGDPAQFIGMRLRHLYVCGLVDGELPKRSTEDPLLPDDDRVALGRVFGRPLLPLGARSEALEALSFSQLLMVADEIELSYNRGSEEGAPVLASPLIEPLLEEGGGVPVREVARDPLPRVREARALSELWARATLEVHGDAPSRLSHFDEEGRSLYRRLTALDPARMRRLEARVEMERMRIRYFTDKGTPHAFVGLLEEDDLQRSLVDRLPGTQSYPLSAAAIETYASCHFRQLLRLLGAAPIEESGEELAPMARGRFHHEVLERLFRRLGEESLLPISSGVNSTVGARQQQILEEVFTEVVKAWQEKHPVGHPALFRIHVARIRWQVEALLAAEAAKPPAPGCTPRLFEHSFGPVAIPPSLETEPLPLPLYVRGIIDRIDIGTEQAVVFDYKTGARDRYRAQLTEEALCDTAWQLPLYAAVMRAELAFGEVRAAFYSLRDARPTAALSDPDLIALDGLGRARRREAGGPNVADALHALVGQMRAGRFEVAPKQGACDRCRMESACRVVKDPPEPGELREETSS